MGCGGGKNVMVYNEQQIAIQTGSAEASLSNNMMMEDERGWLKLTNA